MYAFLFVHYKLFYLCLCRSSACILVELETSPVPLTSKLECFIIHTDENVDQMNWNNVSSSILLISGLIFKHRSI